MIFLNYIVLAYNKLVVIICSAHIFIMKKTLTYTMLLLSGYAFAQAEGTNAPPQYSMPQEEAEVLNNEFAFTLSGGLSTADDKDPYETHMGFISLEWDRYISENHAFTFEIGFGYGGDDFGKPELYSDYADYSNWYDSHSDEYTDFSFQRMSVNMMVGFRTVIPIVRRLSATVGIKGGVDFQCLSLDHSVERYHDPYYDRYTGIYYPGGWKSDFEHDQVAWAAGFVYAAYAGINYEVSEKVSLELGYQFRGTTAQPEVTNYWQEGCPKVKGAKLNFHEIRFGVRGKF